MRPPTPTNYVGVDMTSDLLQTATPPALGSTLVDADSWLVDAAITPYCGTGRIFDSCTGTTSAEHDRFFSIMVAPGAVHGRMAVSTSGIFKSVLPSGQSLFIQAYTNAGGTSGAFLIRRYLPFSKGLGFPHEQAFTGSVHGITMTGDNINDTPDVSPGIAIDRQFELQTSGVATVEPCRVTMAAGVSLAVSQLVEDLESL